MRCVQIQEETMWAGAKDVTKKQAKVSLEAQTWIRCEKPLDDKSSEEGISLSGNRKAWWESPLLPARALGPEGRDRMNSLPRKSQELENAGPERRRDPSPTAMS